MITEQSHVNNDASYDAFVQRINERYNAIVGPIFETDAIGLYEAYLQAFPEGEARQYHTCNCCKAFIERFGGLVHVGDNGEPVSAIWNEDEAPEHYKSAIAAMIRLVRRAKITMPFLSSDGLYGTPIKGDRKDGTGQWHHFAVAPGDHRIYRGTVLKNAFQAASEKREEFNSVIQALDEYKSDAVATALKLLKDDQLGNSEAAVGQAQFLADLHALEQKASGHERRRNLVYRAVVTAPSGFCHPRSSMIATLLDDIAAGKTFEQAKARWDAKMHPLQYQRPQAAPTAGAIKAAEDAFAKLGAGSALRRRIATLADVLEKLWVPKESGAPDIGGIFASVKPKGQEAKPMSMRAPAVVMTWEKFQRNILPTAEVIEVYIGHQAENFSALTTAADPDAVPLLQWDRLDRRNPVAWYVWNGGSPAGQWGLTAGRFHKLSAVTLKPHQWFGGEFSHHEKGVLFLIEGARETRNAGSAIFPSLLKGEFHGFRSVVEGYSRVNNLEGLEQGSACGLLFSGSNKVLLRVTAGGQVGEYQLDRWD